MFIHTLCNIIKLLYFEFYFYLADDSEYTAIPVHLWTKHVAELHADGDIGFSREYEVLKKLFS